jgi:nitric oxide reductase subunit B
MKKLWIAFVAVTGISFGVLGWVGYEIYQKAPPIPETVLSTDGSTVIASGEIARGQNVWQSLGGMETGSIWGHGSYVAPDWSADWLHRELVAVLDEWAKAEGAANFEGLHLEKRAALQARLTELYRRNDYNSVSKTLTVSPVRALAADAVRTHLSDVFSSGRTEYAIPAGALTDPVKLRELSAFIFWTAWATAAVRPGTGHSYTNNWPPRTPDRKPTDARHPGFLGGQRHPLVGGNRPIGVVLRREIRAGS